MLSICKRAAAAAFVATAGLAQAATFDLTGTIENHSDVVRIAFTLERAATGVRVWTDSFQNNLNFDPITAVWRFEDDGDASLIGQNDDNAGIAPGQTAFDSGLVFAELAAGTYLFTIATFNNFAAGSLLSEGFGFDDQAPIPLAQWSQPGSRFGPEGVWSVHLDGVDSAAAPIPEPASYVLMLAGLGMAGWLARRRRLG